VCTVKSKVASKKKAKSKQYIPRVWMEGKKMYIRGKGELQLSNDEIYRKLQKQAKDNRNIADLAATADEVRTGSQPTLSNYFSGKQSTRNTKKGGMRVQNLPLPDQSQVTSLKIQCAKMTIEIIHRRTRT
jgi:hypothetical protein